MTGPTPTAPPAAAPAAGAAAAGATTTPPSARPPPPTLIVVNNISRELDKRRGEDQGTVLTRKQSATKFLRSYGVGMVLGFIVVDWTATKIRKVPLIGAVAGPVLGALSAVIGPALGAAAVYGIVHGDGDVFAARHKVTEGAAYMGTEAKTRVRDAQAHVKRELPKLQARSKEGAKRMAESINEGAKILGENAKEGVKLIGDATKDGVKRLTGPASAAPAEAK